MDTLLIIGALALLAVYGYWVYNQGYDNGLSDGALAVLVSLYKDKQTTKAYIMKSLPSLTNEEFYEIFEEES
jgi:hypothetical protein